MHAVTDPLTFEFFTRALIGVVLVSVLCAMVGAYVVLRGLSYIGDAMSHAVFPGIVGAYLLHANLLIGAILASILTSLGIGYVTQRSGLRQDSAIGIVFVGMFALGVTLLSRADGGSRDLASFLVGNPLGVSGADLTLAAVVTGVVALVLLGVQKELLLVSFDPTEARAIGLPVRRLNNLLLILIGLVVVLTIQLVGTTLSVSMLITSSASARLLTTSLKRMMVLAAVLGSVGGAAGLYASYYLDLAPGATIVLTNTAVFLLSLMFRRRDQAPAP
nr:metal ABC transporter permease [Deinococcus maricopensis]